ncbi:MAG: phosphoglycerate dehydrogenase [Candidatus Cloacimonadota bacterium]|nr:MAG: phosphoglycerate dehydrogenase [Candidatus Cloacimonadota bacterium]
MTKVLVTGELHPIAIELMRKEGLEVDVHALLEEDKIIEIIKNYQGIVTRSQTAVNKSIIDAGVQLKVIGRAAIGVDNIDVDYATKKGVLVVHVPSDNVVSAAEHTIALLLSAIRNLGAAGALLKSGKWSRKEFVGSELLNKKLGIIGLGKVGSHVAKIAHAFGMDIYAYDPYISKEKFEKHHAIKVDNLNDLLTQVDILTIHTPKTKTTLGMLDYLNLKEMKQGSVLINCARGGIVDEDALFRLLNEGHIAKAGIDVFAQEPIINHPLFSHPNCVCTPHLGASTIEAQFRVGRTIAKQMVKALKNQVVDHPVNMPLVEGEIFPHSRAFCSLAEKMGCIASQLTKFNPSFMRMIISGKDLGDQSDLLKAAYFKGFFQNSTEARVNYINSAQIALDRNLNLEMIKDPLHETYSHLLKIEIYGDGEPVTLSGTVFATKSRIVELSGYSMDIEPEGNMLLIKNQDVPGMIGFVGGLLGDHKINIARWELGRKKQGGEALSFLLLDQVIDDEIKVKLTDHESIIQVTSLDLSFNDEN